MIEVNASHVSVSGVMNMIGVVGRFVDRWKKTTIEEIEEKRVKRRRDSDRIINDN